MKILTKKGLFLFSALAVAGSLIGAYLIFFSQPASAAWYSSGADTWTFRKKLTIDYTKVSGGSDLSNFPVLVSLTDASLRKAQSSGNDILFTSSDGTTKLDHEIETFTQSSGTLIAWVEIPTLSASADTSIYMYYGNASSSDQSNKTGVWDSNYAGIWHLKEDPSGAAPQMKNSTATANTDGTAYRGAGAMPASNQVSSQIDGGLTLNGSNDYVTVTSNDSLNMTAAITIEAWVKATTYTTAGWQEFVTKGTNALGRQYELRPDKNDGQLQFILYNTGSTLFCAAQSSSALPTNQWVHVVGTYDGSNCRAYINGAQNGTPVSVSNTIQTTVSDLGIGRYSSNDSYYNGQIDEVRVSSSARTPGWIATEYNNQSSPGTFFNNRGSEEKSQEPLLYLQFDEGQGTTANDSSSQKNNGILAGTTVPAWQTEDQCIFGKCLYFDGSTSKVTVANAVNGVKTISFWVRPMTNTAAMADLDGGTHYIDATSGTIATHGFTNSTIYVNGIQTATLTANRWQQIEITTTDTVNTTNAFKIGTNNTTFMNGFIDEFKIYDYVRSSSQIKADFINRGAVKGVSAQMGQNSNDPLNQGLVGYWKMDDGVSGDAQTLTDSSGNSNNGTTENGANGTGMDCTVAGKFGKGCSFDGIDDSANTSTADTISPTDAISVSGWFMPNETFSGSSNNTQGIIDKGDYQFFLDKTDGKTKWVLNDSTAKAFASLGTTTTSEITNITAWNGNLYVTGSFTSIGNCISNCKYIAKWDGSSWSALGTGLNNSAYNSSVWNGNLYVTGSFTSAGTCTSNCNKIAKWDGSTFSALGTGLNNTGYTMASFNDNLVVGGSFTTAGGGAAVGIAQWNGSSWSAVGDGTMAGTLKWVLTLTIWNGNLYAGGFFTSISGVNNTSRIAKWDGSSWSALSTGANGSVIGLAVWNGNLYVTGSFTSAGTCTSNCNRIAKWDGSTFSALSTGMNASVNTLATYDGNLYAIGSFTSAGTCNTNCNYIAMWDGSTWSALSTGISSSTHTMDNLYVWNGDLYVVGKFVSAGGISLDNIAKWGTPNTKSLASITSSWSADTWYHFVTTFDGKKIRLYINGREEASAETAMSSIASSSLALLFGKTYGSQKSSDDNSEGPFNGILDEFRVYNRALSGKEVSDLYNWAPGPVVNLKMEEGVGTAANDSSGNGYNGTVNSGTWTTGKYGKGVKINGTTGSNVSIPDFAY